MAAIEQSPVQKFAITLHVETGNIIYEEFENVNDAIEFIRKYCTDSKAILDRITPKKRSE